MNIIVNGASKGIGREIVSCLSEDTNNHILATGRSGDKLKKLQKDSLNGNVSILVMDISVIENEAETIKNKIQSCFSSIDILINVSGLLIVKDFTDTTVIEARKIMDTNFFGPVFFSKILLPLMPAKSHILNISSMGGFQGSVKYKGLSYYSSSKAALACMTECMAIELSDRQISVNCLALGSVQTEMFNTAFPGLKANSGPKEMAEFISYFALNGHRFFNGKVLPVAAANP